MRQIAQEDSHSISRSMPSGSILWVHYTNGTYMEYEIYFCQHKCTYDFIDSTTGDNNDSATLYENWAEMIMDTVEVLF